MSRLPRGVKTPSYEYYLPILRILNRIEGRVRVAEIYAPIFEEMRHVLNKDDLEDLEDNERPEPRWINTVRVARDELVKRGFLYKMEDVGRGYWKITPQGCEYLSQFK
jgi:hypothetical protein